MAASPPSFSSDLWGHWDEVTAKADQGSDALAEFAQLIRGRIQSERLYCRSLLRLSQRPLAHRELGSLNTALNRLSVDMAQSHNERLAFANSLEQDVLNEVLEMKTVYDEVNKKFILQGQKAIQGVQKTREVLRKLRRRYGEANSDLEAAQASMQRIQDSGDKGPTISLTMYTLRKKESNAKAVMTTTLTRFRHAEGQKDHAENVYTDVMKSVLDGIQSNEEARIRCLRSSLRKLVVFETSLVANRGYDMKDMAEKMEDIDVTSVVAEFVFSIAGAAPPSDSPAVVAHTVEDHDGPPEAVERTDEQMEDQECEELLLSVTACLKQDGIAEEAASLLQRCFARWTLIPIEESKRERQGKMLRGVLDRFVETTEEGTLDLTESAFTIASFLMCRLLAVLLVRKDFQQAQRAFNAAERIRYMHSVEYSSTGITPRQTLLQIVNSSEECLTHIAAFHEWQCSNHSNEPVPEPQNSDEEQTPRRQQESETNETVTVDPNDEMGEIGSS